jgi:hypothetical protein
MALISIELLARKRGASRHFQAGDAPPAESAAFVTRLGSSESIARVEQLQSVANVRAVDSVTLRTSA